MKLKRSEPAKFTVTALHGEHFMKHVSWHHRRVFHFWGASSLPLSRVKFRDSMPCIPCNPQWRSRAGPVVRLPAWWQGTETLHKKAGFLAGRVPSSHHSLCYMLKSECVGNLALSQESEGERERKASPSDFSSLAGRWFEEESSPKSNTIILLLSSHSLMGSRTHIFKELFKNMCHAQRI